MGAEILCGNLRSISFLKGILILSTVAAFVFATGCTATAPARPGPTPLPTVVPVNHTVNSIELVFFHPVPGCDSCEQVSLLANETVTAYFSQERAAGKITFLDVNLNDPANLGIVHRYGAYTESLFIGVNDETGFRKTEIVDIWYYAYDHEEYMKHLKGILDRTLAGKE